MRFLCDFFRLGDLRFCCLGFGFGNHSRFGCFGLGFFGFRCLRLGHFRLSFLGFGFFGNRFLSRGGLFLRGRFCHGGVFQHDLEGTGQYRTGRIGPGHGDLSRFRILDFLFGLLGRSQGQGHGVFAFCQNQGRVFRIQRCFIHCPGYFQQLVPVGGPGKGSVGGGGCFHREGDGVAFFLNGHIAHQNGQLRILSAHQAFAGDQPGARLHDGIPVHGIHISGLGILNRQNHAAQMQQGNQEGQVDLGAFFHCQALLSVRVNFRYRVLR